MILGGVVSSGRSPGFIMDCESRANHTFPTLHSLMVDIQ